MSTYVDKAINPKTLKIQDAWFIDDFYGQHQYGVAFRKDGGDAVFSADKIVRDEYDIYPVFQVDQPNTEKLDN